MFALIFIAVFIFLVGFLIGWGIKSDIRNGVGKMSPEDKIINEMRNQRAADYFNNPVVKELEKH